ncbi:LptF/LptG family permease [Alkalitalea saponilacus]|uniref:Lipopolysaccharide export system permease protein n=1 Tax=Alkalitalea saponilacus TaxID=889453 RepID=A0A1T5HHN8_9BACT|nr:LptF/LptG family permease [Alkalitalea saponilacus]ASB48148.1 permease [Alkalitalea saponilacus]SKC20186.1 lipopolysaccharide export system permease protein [Alkalitalea saponilacus]
MKKLHLFILKSFIGPLIMTFFIAMFILVMQFLWRYVDDLVGKGLEWTVLGELLFYASLQVVPMALPLAILLAALMTFGNLGENYELTALKAAGVSLLKIMKPISILIVAISGFAYAFSNNVLPVANLKLVSILHGIRETRLEMDIKERVFYRGVDDFSIKVNEKDRETNMLRDVMIYDHRDRHARNSNVTLADSGILQMSADKRHLVLTLYDGIRYDERVTAEGNRRQQRRDSRLFRTDEFRKQVAIMQVHGFDFSRTDESLFRQSDRMKNIAQLTHDLDSIRGERGVFVDLIEDRSSLTYFSRIHQTHANRLEMIDTASVLVNVDSLFLTLEGSQKQMVIQNALRTARDLKQSIDDQMRFIEREDLRIRRHVMEIHRKFTLSFACLIFFFIGAPLGAIIRKGGLGMPVVISIFFFIVYYVIDTMGAKFARDGVWMVHQGMWLSSFVLLPIGIFLTYKSATDSALLNADVYYSNLRKFRETIEKYLKKRRRE